MWTMTTTGFTSAVEYRDDPSLLVIRARDKDSLMNLASDLGLEPDAVYTSFPSDYPFRVLVPKTRYAQWVFDQVLGIEYDNFKSHAATERDGDYVRFLHEVWSAGLALTDEATHTKNEAAWAERDHDWRTHRS